MYEAFCSVANRNFTAEQFGALPAVSRLAYRPTLTCTGCGADAYFMKTASNGRAACFGARPHEDDCELASADGETLVGGGLTEVETLLPQGESLRLRPVSISAPVHVSVDEIDSSKPAAGKRHIGGGLETAGQASLGLNMLLRRLVREPAFRQSRVTLRLPDGTVGTVREHCVLIRSAGREHRDRIRIFWGTIRYARADDKGGAWLNTGGWGSPALHLTKTMLDQLFISKHLTELEDLHGAAFIFYGALRMKRMAAEEGDHDVERFYLFPNDPEWFTVRLDQEDTAR